MLFYLVNKGIPEHCIWGYHDGWPFERLQTAFLHLKRLDIEGFREHSMAVAQGAGAIFSSDSFEKFMRESQSMIDRLKAKRLGTEEGDDEAAKQQEKQERSLKDFSAMNQLAGLVQGVGWNQIAKPKGRR